MNFEFTTESFIMIGLFLTITFMFTIIIVYFLTKIKTLSSFLREAKEIDESKNEKISTLEIKLQDEKIYNINIMNQLKNFEKNRETLSQKEREIMNLKENINLQSQEHVESIHYQKTTLQELKSHHDILNDNYDNLIEKYRLLKKRNETLVKENNTFHARLRETQGELNHQQKQNIDKLAQMKEHRIELKKVFDGSSKEFSRLTQENLASMIKPLESQVDDFKKQVQTLYSNESKDRDMFNQQIVQDTLGLTNRVNGGEVILEKLLEASTLRKGIEYTMEVSLKNDEGKLIVHLPDNRDLIVDNTIKEAHLLENIKKIRKHIEILSNKNYEKVLGTKIFDFILMFIPIEGALETALEKDTSLYDDAFKKQILLLSPTTLLIAIRAIENIWKYDKQNKNAKDIASRAGALYDKFVSFSDDMIKISKQFDGLQVGFKSA